MLGPLPSLKKNPGAPLGSRKAMLETLFRHLDMVRLSVGAMVMVAVVGCTGLIDGGSDGMTKQEREALAKFEEGALPVLQSACAGCHANDVKNVGFMKGADATEIRASIKAYNPPSGGPVINTEEPEVSRLLTKGQHDGPLLTSPQASALLEWIQAEQESAKHDPLNPIVIIATPAAAVQICTAGLPGDATCPTNHIALDGLNKVALPGTEITFTAQALQSGLYITNLQLVGGTAGAYIEHPLFVSVAANGDTLPDSIDRFFDIKQNQAANMSGQIAGGTAQFVGFKAEDKMYVSFKDIKTFQMSTTTTPKTGCKDLAKFKTNVAPLVNQRCANCHAGNANANAKSTMDVTGVGTTDDAMLLLACNAMRSRVDLVNTAMSGIYLAPQPGNNTNHPFKFNPATDFTAFQTSVDVWVQAEKTAP